MDKRIRFCKNLRFRSAQGGEAVIEVCADANGTWTEQEHLEILKDATETMREAQDKLSEMLFEF